MIKSRYHQKGASLVGKLSKKVALLYSIIRRRKLLLIKKTTQTAY